MPVEEEILIFILLWNYPLFQDSAVLKEHFFYRPGD
jgi:hypothetical protein